MMIQLSAQYRKWWKDDDWTFSAPSNGVLLLHFRQNRFFLSLRSCVHTYLWVHYVQWMFLSVIRMKHIVYWKWRSYCCCCGFVSVSFVKYNFLMKSFFVATIVVVNICHIHITNRMYNIRFFLLLDDYYY